VIVKKFARKIFGRKTLEIIGGWRLNNEKIYNVNIIRVVGSRGARWAGQMGSVEEIRNACGIYVGNLLGPLGRHRCRWKGNKKFSLEQAMKALRESRGTLFYVVLVSPAPKFRGIPYTSRSHNDIEEGGV
jgi:hypothetical protein